MAFTCDANLKFSLATYSLPKPPYAVFSGNRPGIHREARTAGKDRRSGARRTGWLSVGPFPDAPHWIPDIRLTAGVGRERTLCFPVKMVHGGHSFQICRTKWQVVATGSVFQLYKTTVRVVTSLR